MTALRSEDRLPDRGRGNARRRKLERFLKSIGLSTVVGRVHPDKHVPKDVADRILAIDEAIPGWIPDE